MQPFLGNRGGQDRPVLLRVDPRIEVVFQLRLLEIQVLGLAHFQIGGARNGGARLDQVGRVQLLGAILALVATGLVIAAIGAGALDVAIRQKAVIGLGKDLPFGHFLD